jgi:hypothetical protein
MRWQQVGNCLTAPHSSNHSLTDIALQHLWVKNAIWRTFFTKAKGTLPPEKGHFAPKKGHFLYLLKTWGLAPPPPVPMPLNGPVPFIKRLNLPGLNEHMADVWRLNWTA